jgi:hypothetical protein
MLNFRCSLIHFLVFLDKRQPPELNCITLIIEQKIFRCTSTFMHQIPGVICVQLCTAVRSVLLTSLTMHIY